MSEAKKQGNGADQAQAGAAAREIQAFKLDVLRPIEVENLRWRLNAPEGVTPADLERAELWATCADKKLRSFDVIEAVGFEGRWWAEVLCLEAQGTQGNFRTRLKLLRSVEIEPADAREQRTLPAGHEIRFDPQTHTYTAYRIKGNVPLSSVCSTWELAFRQLVDHATLRGN